MARKSAHMIRAGKHKIVVLGKTYGVEKVEEDGGILVISLDNGEQIRRTRGAKLEVVS